MAETVDADLSTNCHVYVDSAAKLFRAALREELSKQGMGRIAVIGTDKSDGIRPRIELGLHAAHAEAVSCG